MEWTARQEETHPDSDETEKTPEKKRILVAVGKGRAGHETAQSALGENPRIHVTETQPLGVSEKTRHSVGEGGIRRLDRRTEDVEMVVDAVAEHRR